MPSEQFAQFAVAGQQLYGMLHLPDGAGPHPAVALVHGFTGNAAEDHFVFTKLARQLARDGVAALRFDCRGSGWSEGDFADMTIEGEVADALAALDVLATHPEIDDARLGLLGLSLGGCVAALAASRSSHVRALALWAAVAHPAQVFFESVLPQDAATADPTQPLDRGGLTVGPAFLAGLHQAHPLDELASYRNAGLVVHGTADTVVPLSEASAYIDALRPGYRQLFAVDGGDHTFARADHERQVIGLTSAWFVAML